MDVDQLKTRCPMSEPVCVGILQGYEFYITNRGYASIREKKRSMVYGLLANMTPFCVMQMDVFECAPRIYSRSLVTVKTCSGFEVNAFVYIDDSVDGEAKPFYMKRIRAAAWKLRLPKTYRYFLKAFKLEKEIVPPVYSGRASEFFHGGGYGMHGGYSGD